MGDLVDRRFRTGDRAGRPIWLSEGELKDALLAIKKARFEWSRS